MNEQPYTEVDVQLVVAATSEALIPDGLDGLARAALDALAAAGRLLPEGASHEERLRVALTDSTGRTVNYDPVRDMDRAGIAARRRKAAGWGVEIQHRHIWRTEYAPVHINEEGTE